MMEIMAFCSGSVAFLMFLLYLIERAYGYFYAIGDVIHIRMRAARDRFFVEMSTEEEADRAVQLYQDKEIWDGYLVAGPMRVASVIAKDSDVVYTGPSQP